MGKIEKVLSLLALALLLWMEFVFHANQLTRFPSNVHAWAQSDRYALALGFVENDLNFFKPQNYILNHQFPDDWNQPSETRNTAVDFPIHDFIPAVAMKISGSHSPAIFRTYILLYALIGLFFLYRLALFITEDFYKAILSTLFIATSPVLMYYQNGFLPTIPSFSNAIIGIYFYVKYLKNEAAKDFYLAFVFLTLAALSRFTFAIPAIAVVCLEILRILRKQTSIQKKYVPILLSIVLIAGYNFHNANLRKSYGSDFLSSTLPAKSVQEAQEIWSVVKERWGEQYFTTLHYKVFGFIAAAACLFWIANRLRIKKFEVNLWLLCGGIFIGCFGFSILMMQQYLYHDYYFIDTFLLPISLLVILCLAFIPKLNHWTWKVFAIATICIIGANFSKKSMAVQRERRHNGPENTVHSTITNFTQSDIYLDSLNISRDAKILVLEPVCPQIPFILMQRTGYIAMWMNHDAIENALNWNFDYIVYQNSAFVHSVYEHYPEIIHRLEEVADNGKITVCKLLDKPVQRTLIEFENVENFKPVLSEMLTFETPASSEWKNIETTEETPFQGQFSGRITSSSEFGLSYKKQLSSQLFDAGRRLNFSGNFKGKLSGDLMLVLSLESNNESIYYKSYQLKDFIRGSDEWENLKLTFDLPAIKTNTIDLSLYLWNRGGNEMLVDDFEFALY